MKIEFNDVADARYKIVVEPLPDGVVLSSIFNDPDIIEKELFPTVKLDKEQLRDFIGALLHIQQKLRTSR